MYLNSDNSTEISVVGMYEKWFYIHVYVHLHGSVFFCTSNLT